MENARRQFIARHGWSSASIEPLAGDASFRRYFRLIRPDDGAHALLMQAPSPQENLSAFIQIDHHLEALGLRVPRVMHSDLSRGLALIEDLGDATFTKVLETAPGRETELYELALEVLIHLRTSPQALSIDLPDYDRQRLLDEAALLVDWFVPAYAAPVGAGVRDEYLLAWSRALDTLDRESRALVLRDFHVDNLMLMDAEHGLSRCALLDFQDAVIGHPAYDLASLLEDARRDLPEGLRKMLYSRFVECLGFSRAFDRSYTILAAQRHAKVLGIFVRLCRRDGKPVYLQHLPRTARLLRRHLGHEAMAAVRDWLSSHCPVLLDEGFELDAVRCRDG